MDKVTKRFSRRTRWLSGAVATLFLLYAVLLIPERPGALPTGAGKQPFAWKQDAFWSELESAFNDARRAGCQNLRTRIDKGVAEIQDSLEQLATNRFPPEAALFATLEAGLFQLAPLIAACPDRFNDYFTLVTRARAEVKRQSRDWNVNLPSVRQRIYRLLFGSRMALEEVLLQAPDMQEFPAAIPSGQTASHAPSTTLLGMTLHSGDILLSRGGAPTSALIARGNDYPGSFSHVALVHIDAQTGKASAIESHIEQGVTVSSLDQYLADKKLRIVVMRLRSDLPEVVASPALAHQAAESALAQARSKHIPYDFQMDYREHSAQFCSEVVSAAYEAVGMHLWKGTTLISGPAVVAWLRSLGVRYFETQEPADLEYDPQLELAGEWRDNQTLLKAHVDDAVIDVMLEHARPDQPLPHDRWLLPVTRCLKLYSFGLNLLGKIGPIPEGMSATTALRVKKLRNEHAIIAARVMSSVADFKRSKGYTPPFWELHRMAETATKHGAAGSG